MTLEDIFKNLTTLDYTVIYLFNEIKHNLLSERELKYIDFVISNYLRDANYKFQDYYEIFVYISKSYELLKELHDELTYLITFLKDKNDNLSENIKMYKIMTQNEKVQEIVLMIILSVINTNDAFLLQVTYDVAFLLLVSF